MRASAILSVEDLHKSYGSGASRHTIIDGLSFSLRRGECYGLLGPNGAGKTTTLRLCLGLTEPDSGYVTDHAVFSVLLDDPMHGHKPRTHNDFALRVEDVRPYDEIGDTGLILQRDEADAFRAARPLADQHQPRHRHALPVPNCVQPVGRDELLSRIMLAQEAHRVRLQA